MIEKEGFSAPSVEETPEEFEFNPMSSGNIIDHTDFIAWIDYDADENRFICNNCGGKRRIPKAKTVRDVKEIRERLTLFVEKHEKCVEKKSKHAKQ